MIRALLLSTALVTAMAASAYAESASSEAQRDANQQQRIDHGLKDGQLSTGEASKLENGEAKIDNQESKDLSKGPLTQGEKSQINREQNQESREIKHDDHNDVRGNPASASDRRMQNDVQRDANQEKRIENGRADGQLNNHEMGNLEKQQAQTDSSEAKAGANGHVSAGEQSGIQHQENGDSGAIKHDRHD